MSKVKKLEIKNFMGIQEVNIQPKNELVIIAGDNAQGKTSIIKGLEIALQGRKAMAGITKIVHEGEKESDIIADLGDIVIKRHFTEDGREALKVIRGDDGTDIKRPQELLDRMTNKMLKPVEFMKMKPKEQKELLINSLNLDIDLPEMEIERQKIYDIRTVKGRDRDIAKAHLIKMEPPESWEDMPESEISVTDLVKELEKRKDHNLEITKTECDIVDMKEDIDDIDDRIKDYEKRIQDLKNKKDEIKNSINEKQDWLEKIVKLDEDEIREDIDKVEQQNIRIREANKYREYHRNVANLNIEYDNLTNQIAGIDKAVEASLARADMPLPGLEIYPDGLGVNGMPLAQIAESDQLKAAIKISMGLEPKPELDVLIIENGRDLTEKNWEIVREMAKENGYQIWIQYVDTSGEIGFVIKDGRVDKIN